MSYERQVLGPVEFPSAGVPDDPRRQRLLGLYAMREPGLFMQRVKIPGGRITTAQWRGLARLAETYTPEYPLHLTTRQDIELHGVRRDAAGQVHEALAEMGLTTIGACGDTPRNITLCPGGGLCRGCGDLMPLVLALKAFVEQIPEVYALPRKFKISLSGCPEGCAQPWINDLSFVGTGRGVFDVIGAGSLGHRPGTGVRLAQGAPTQEVFACTLASIRIFQRHGDRQHRMKARLRHVRERFGNDAFQKMFDLELHRALQENGFPQVEIASCASELKDGARLAPPLGDLTPAQARRLADLCDAHCACTHLDTHQGVRIFSANTQPVREALEHDALLSGTLSLLPIISCPGTTWCTKGVANSRAMAERLQALFASLGPTLRSRIPAIYISGCPNQCAQSGVGAIGLVGLIRTVGGQRTECFRILVGGGEGKTPDLAIEVAAAVPSEEVPQFVARMLTQYADHALEGESFSAFARRRAEALVQVRYPSIHPF